MQQYTLHIVPRQSYFQEQLVLCSGIKVSLCSWQLLPFQFSLCSYCCDLSLKVPSSPRVQQSKRKSLFFLKVTGEALNNLYMSKLEQDKGMQRVSQPCAIAGTAQALAQLAAFQLASSRKTPPSQNTSFKRGCPPLRYDFLAYRVDMEPVLLLRDAKREPYTWL